MKDLSIESPIQKKSKVPKSGAILGHKDTYYLLSSPYITSKEDAELSIQNFFGNKTEHYRFTKTEKLSRDELSNLLHNHKTIPIPADVQNTDHDFISDIKDFHEEDSDIKKFVSCTRSTMHNSDSVTVGNFLKAAIREPRSGYTYAFWDEAEGFIGITPEPSLIRDNNCYKTFSIAGTSKGKSEILNSHKMKEEQELVSTQIRDSLYRAGVEQIEETDKIINANGLVHRQTEFSFTDSKNSFFNLLRTITPTGALGVCPKEQTPYLKNKRFFKIDKDDRTFGGNFIFSIDDYQISLVMIRSTAWNKNVSWIDTGCGITKRSSIKEELREARLKRKKVESYFYE